MDNKKSNIKERILEIAKYKGIAYEKFSEMIGMTYASFKGMQKNTPINSNALDIILSLFPDISAEWLVAGKGEMWQVKAEPPEKTSTPQQLIDWLREKDMQVSEKDKEIKELGAKLEYYRSEYERLRIAIINSDNDTLKKEVAV